MSTTTITIGWTKPALGYSNYDGYRPGADQHVETIAVEDLPEDWTLAQIADAVFEALNGPHVPHDSPQGRILFEVTRTGYRGQGAHFSLSVGDTVTVDDEALACTGLGWERIEPPTV